MNALYSSFLSLVCFALAACAVGPGVPGTADALRAESDRAYESGQWQAARAGYEKLVMRNPNDIELWLRLANIDQREQRWESAQEKYVKVIGMSPRNRPAHYNLAVLHLTQAEQHFQYFSALGDPGAQPEHLTALLAAISDFAQEGKAHASALDELSAMLRSRSERRDVGMRGTNGVAPTRRGQ